MFHGRIAFCSSTLCKYCQFCTFFQFLSTASFILYCPSIVQDGGLSLFIILSVQQAYACPSSVILFRAQANSSHSKTSLPFPDYRIAATAPARPTTTPPTTPILLPAPVKGETVGLLVEAVPVGVAVSVVFADAVTATTLVTVSVADTVSNADSVSVADSKFDEAEADSIAVVSDAVAVGVNSNTEAVVVVAADIVVDSVTVVEDVNADEELEEMGLPSVTLKGARPSEGYAMPLKEQAASPVVFEVW